jgi:bifunctional non-homologous end joining protein LigD
MRRAAARRSDAHTLEIPGAIRAAYPGFVDPCLAVERNAAPKGDQWLPEIKYDGYRAQGHLIDGKPAIYTRRGYDWSDRFSSVTDALRTLRAHTAIVDGEVVVPDERGIADYHLLQQDLSQHRADRLVYFVFDLLYLDGFDLRQSPLIERRRALSTLLTAIQTQRIRFSEHIEADPAAVFERACAMQLEGILYKDRNSLYRSGRQETWFKVKCLKSETFPIVAFVEKLGASPRRIASLYLGRWEDGKLLYAGKAQTGFKQEALYELRERLDPYIRPTSPLSIPVKKPKATWIEPVLEAEIQYSALTAEKRLRAPVYKGIRDDLALHAPTNSSAAERGARVYRGGVPKQNILQWLPDAVVPSKEQLAAYWKKVAPRALEYLAGRPLKLVRHTRSTTFYHMGPLPPVPESVHQLKVEKRQGGQGTRLWINDLAGLLGLVELGAVELHPWNSTVEDLEHPDVLVFDLDPGIGIAWQFVVDTALAMRELLKTARLDSWPKLTGGKGVHIMCPISSSGMTHDQAHRYSRELAEKLAASEPTRYTTSAAMSARAHHLFIDYLRNGRGTTAVGTYSPRARSGFPIAAPVSWRELERGVRPNTFTMAEPFPRTHKGRSEAGKRNLRRTAQFSESGLPGPKQHRRPKPARKPGQQTHRR